MLLLATPIMIDWKMLGPCDRCVSFEKVATHAAGRAAVVSGCVLAKLYGLPAHDALEYVGKAYATRGDERRQSPETLDQRRLMSRWIIAKVPPNA